ncbi:MAG: DUF559 domain-containing protein [Thermomicrobiales bacterium]
MTNTDYWNGKLARNTARDAQQTSELTAAGWKVLRYWGHQIEADAGGCATRIAETVRERSTQSRRFRPG